MYEVPPTLKDQKREKYFEKKASSQVKAWYQAGDCSHSLSARGMGICLTSPLLLDPPPFHRIKYHTSISSEYPDVLPENWRVDPENQFLLERKDWTSKPS